MNVYILQVMSILRQGYCSPKYLYFLLPGQEKPVRDPDGTRRKEILIPDTTDFRDRWDSAVDALESAIKVLRHPQEYGAVSSCRSCPTSRSFPALLRLRAHSEDAPGRPATRCAAETASLVLGLGFQQPLLGLGRIHERLGTCLDYERHGSTMTLAEPRADR